jgi:hypothetical protein
MAYSGHLLFKEGGLQMNTRNRQLEFLRENSSPTIQHLLARLNEDVAAPEFQKNYQALRSLPELAYWKANIPVNISNETILGSSDGCFENAFGKLLQFGLNLDDILTTEQMQNCIGFLETTQNDDIYTSLARYVVAGYLLGAGSTSKVVSKTVTDRIDALYGFVSSSPFKHDIYVDSIGTKLPKSYQSKKLVNPTLYENGELVLPFIHDIFVFGNIQRHIPNDYQNKIAAIVDYVCDPKYQSFDYGYGVVRSSGNKLHAMGWSAHMPLFNEALSSEYFKKGLIFRMGLFSRFENAAVKIWLNSTMKKLANFRIDEVRYCFAGALLPETTNSYFLNGRHTSLNENRRQKNGRIIESTFYAYLCDVDY